jgi:hypothetical protein
MDSDYVIEFTPEEIFEKDLRKIWEEGLRLYLQSYEECSYIFTLPDGSETTCAIHGRWTDHIGHLAGNQLGKNGKSKGIKKAGEFLCSHFRDEQDKKSWRDDISDRFSKFYRQVHSRKESPYKALIELREALKVRNGALWRRIYSNKTCMSCLQGVPDHALFCGHSFCPRCIQEMGTPSPHLECAWSIQHCIICGKEHSQPSGQIVQLKPRCSGARILSLDGGGVRGIVELAVIRSLEKKIDLPNIRLGEMFDLVIGTSTGKMPSQFGRLCEESTNVLKGGL